MAEDSLIPKLRFPEFNGSWLENKLGHAFEMKAGNFVPAKAIQSESNPNLYPCYGGNGLRGYTKSYTHNGKYNLIGRQGALCGNVKLVEGVFHATEHALIVDNYENFDIDFVFNVLNNLKLNRLATGQAQPGLSVSILKSVRFFTTTLPEQQKIASFLSAVDKKIQLLTRKKELLEQYKKGVMQKLFTQEIRFKDENGIDFPEWKEKSFGELFIRVTRKNKENNLNVLTISAQQGLVNQEKYFNKSVSASDVTGYYLLNKGEFAYNKSYSKGYPLGAIKRLKDYPKGVVSTLYICFAILDENSPNYFEHFFESGSMNRSIHKIAQEGARNHGLLNVSVVEFFKDIRIKTPSMKEQVKIAGFLDSLDKKIDGIRNQLEKTKEFKKGLLQQMFV